MVWCAILPQDCTIFSTSHMQTSVLRCVYTAMGQRLDEVGVSLQVHAVDYLLVTEVASFVHLLESCQADLSSLSGVVLGQAQPPPSVVEFQLSSLFERSSLCITTITAFSEGKSSLLALLVIYCPISLPCSCVGVSSSLSLCGCVPLLVPDRMVFLISTRRPVLSCQSEVLEIFVFSPSDSCSHHTVPA